MDELLRDTHFSEEEMMKNLNCSKKTLQNLRAMDKKWGTTKIPPSIKLRTKYYYPKDLFHKWANPHLPDQKQSFSYLKSVTA